MTELLGALLIAYLLGSVPTALLVSRAVADVDIREVGDGNMGALNIARSLGWRWYFVVAGVDAAKGTLGVVWSKQLGLPLEWQMAAGVCAVLGHDFPIFARFRGGQGFATTVGVLFALVPYQTLVGLVVYGILHLLIRSFDLSAAVGMGGLALLVEVSGQPRILLIYTVALLLCIPAKKMIDLPRRRARDNPIETPR